MVCRKRMPVYTQTKRRRLTTAWERGKRCGVSRQVELRRREEHKRERQDQEAGAQNRDSQGIAGPIALESSHIQRSHPGKMTELEPATGMQKAPRRGGDAKEPRSIRSA